MDQAISRRCGHACRPSVAFAALFALLLHSSTTVALPPPDHFTYRLWAGLQISDNRFRDETDRQSDLLLEPRLDFSLLNSGDRIQARGDGEVRLEHSLRGLSDQRARARMGLIVDWALVSERLYWTFQDVADVTTIDPLAAGGPDNRQQTNIFLTGPVLLLGNPDSWTSRVEARAARASAEESRDFNHDRYSVAAWLQRRSDPVRTWSLGAEHSDVRFDRGASLADFERQDLLLRYDHALPHLNLRLVAGRTWIDRVDADSLERALLRASLAWSANASNTFRIDYADELSDSGRDLALAIDARNRFYPEAPRVLIGPGLHRLRSAELRWAHRGLRGEWSVTPFLRDYDYLGSPVELERSARGLRLAGSYDLAPRLTLFAVAGAARNRFESADRQDRDTYAALSAEWRLDPHWALRAGVGRIVRSSNLAGFGYRENTLSLFLVRSGAR